MANSAERNTKQKRIVYDALCELGHPSATEVYERVHENYPSVSRGTVFRLLGTFAQCGRAKKLHFVNSDDRFDATVRPHSHIRCRQCGKIGDVFFPDLEQTLCGIEPEGFTVEGCEVAFIGLCDRCRKSE